MNRRKTHDPRFPIRLPVGLLIVKRRLLGRLIPEAEAWCHQTLGYIPEVCWHDAVAFWAAWFDQPEEAMTFKLRWSDYWK
jgi:hypothetical protein